jgi:hypothetical protein
MIQRAFEARFLVVGYKIDTLLSAFRRFFRRWQRGPLKQHLHAAHRVPIDDAVSQTCDPPLQTSSTE